MEKRQTCAVYVEVFWHYKYLSNKIICKWIRTVRTFEVKRVNFIVKTRYFVNTELTYEMQLGFSLNVNVRFCFKGSLVVRVYC